jgi:hypothetical protein
MELIPILSTIILIATISTFLLAIGAYILYKVRERKIKEMYSRPPDYVEGEVVIPESERIIQPGEKFVKPVYIDPRRQEYEKPREYYQASFDAERKQHEKVSDDEKKITSSKFLKYTSEGYQPASDEKKKKDLKWR